jgi:hypothetical protein
MGVTFSIESTILCERKGQLRDLKTGRVHISSEFSFHLMRGNTKRKRDVTMPQGLDDFIALDCSTTVLVIVFRDSLALISK